MAKTLDFNKLKKQYMNVVLSDDENTVLMITTPTKNVLDSFVAIKDELSGENMSEESIDELYNLCAKIMSRNKTGIIITKEKLYSLFDFEDIIVFIRAYSDFIAEVTNSKN